MPRELEFTFADTQFALGLHKVDRTKLYGRVETETFDINDTECSLATLARDGRTLIPSGGTASGYINTEGLWIDRSELVPIDPDGNQLSAVKSSFSAPTPLGQEIGEDEFLNHPIRLAYALSEESDFPPALHKKLKGGAIYSFGFSYRGGITADPAFILMDHADQIWMLIGEPSDIEYASFEQAGIVAATAEDDDTGGDDFSFDML